MAKWKVIAEDYSSPLTHPASYIDAASSLRFAQIAGGKMVLHLEKI